MRALIYAHFDAHAIVDDYVLFALRSYRQYFDHIIFVSTSDLDATERRKSSAFCDVVIIRDNVGYDFGSWRIGFEAIEAKAYRTITFANDSIYGPCADIKTLIEDMFESKADLWGATINRQFRPHVQSYFMRFGEALIQSNFAEKFWSSIGVIEEKNSLIREYEVGLSKQAEDHGFSIGALVDYDRLTPELRHSAIEEHQVDIKDEEWRKIKEYIVTAQDPNPMQLFWGQTFRLGVPFLKIETFRENPMGMNISGVFRQIKKCEWYDLNLILNHLFRVLPFEKYDKIVGEFEKSN